MSASIVFNFVATEELNVDNEGIVIPSTATSPNEPVSAISNLPNEPVDVIEPLTVPTEFMFVPDGSTTLIVPKEPVDIKLLKINS